MSASKIFASAAAAVAFSTLVGCAGDMPMNLGSPARAAEADAPDIPLDYERFVLDNGLTVIVHEDRKAPVVAVSVWYHVGSKNEPEGQTGFAHLFEHLMFNGTENYDGEWFAPLEQIGATSYNGTTWLDRTNYYQTVPTPALDLVLWMESDRMGHLLGAVDQETLDEQRGVVQNEKRQGDNQPYGRVNYNLYEGLFPPEHPYHHSTIGSMEDLDAASLEDVHHWFETYYGPNNAVLVLAGDIDAATAREHVERYFGDIPAGPEVDTFEAWIPVRESNTTEIMYDEVPQVMINRAWVAPQRSTREYALLDLAASVLADGRNSRLERELVHERELATSVSFGVTPFELASVPDLTVMVRPGADAALTESLMNDIFATFLAEGPTREELERVVTQINAGAVRGVERVNGKANSLAEGELYADDPAFLLQRLEWINAATPQDVRDAARTWLGDGWHQVSVLPTPDRDYAQAGVDRSTGLPPIPAESPTLIFPDIETATLSNGVEVVLAERRAVPVVEMSIQFDAGYAADAGGTLGLASFTASMLSEGAGGRDAFEFEAEMDRLGARISAGSSLDSTSVSLSALRSNLTESVNLWADVIRDPTFEADAMERLRTRWIANIAQEQAQPQALALRLLPGALYGPGHAYAAPLTGSGTVESISSIDRADLETYRETWMRPDNATLFVVGDTTLDEIVPILERAFRGWTAPSTPLPEKNIPQVALPDGPRVILIDKPGAPQSQIMAGHLAPGLGADDDLAIGVVNDALGGLFSSRLNLNLREDKAWSYGAFTTFVSAVGQRPFVIIAPVQTDRTGDSLREIIRELDEYQSSRPVTPEEMNASVSSTARGLPGQYETASAVLGSLVSSARYGRPLDYAATLTEQYENLTLEEVRAATDVIHPNALVWLIVGDLNEIRPQVEAVGIAPIEIWDEDGNPIE